MRLAESSVQTSTHYERLTQEISEAKADFQRTAQEYRMRLRALRRERRAGPGIEE